MNSPQVLQDALSELELAVAAYKVVIVGLKVQIEAAFAQENLPPEEDKQIADDVAATLEHQLHGHTNSLTTRNAILQVAGDILNLLNRVNLSATACTAGSHQQDTEAPNSAPDG